MLFHFENGYWDTWNFPLTTWTQENLPSDCFTQRKSVFMNMLYIPLSIRNFHAFQKHIEYTYIYIFSPSFKFDYMLYTKTVDDCPIMIQFESIKYPAAQQITKMYLPLQHERQHFKIVYMGTDMSVFHSFPYSNTSHNHKYLKQA
jgi:hypothetical protein